MIHKPIYLRDFDEKTKQVFRELGFDDNTDFAYEFEQLREEQQAETKAKLDREGR